MQNQTKRTALILSLVLAAPLAAHSQAVPPRTSRPMSSSFGVAVFPAKGQTEVQQSQDEGQCFVWARSDTGVDPMAPQQVAQTAPQPAPSSADGSRVSGTVRGAAAGTAIGAIAGNTGRGAAIGATAGLMAGDANARNNQARTQQQNAQQQRQSAAQAQAERDRQLSFFNRAFSACLEAKGYIVR